MPDPANRHARALRALIPHLPDARSDVLEAAAAEIERLTAERDAAVAFCVADVGDILDAIAEREDDEREEDNLGDDLDGETIVDPGHWLTYLEAYEVDLCREPYAALDPDSDHGWTPHATREDAMSVVRERIRLKAGHAAFEAGMDAATAPRPVPDVRFPDRDSYDPDANHQPGDC